MINVGLYIKKDKVFESGVNVENYNDYIIDLTKSWIEEQWVDYYIRIIEGTGKGYYFKCNSNSDIALSFDPLPFNLDTTSVYEIYTQVSERVELFQDEKISVTSSIQNSNDIGKLFTDYSQSFTIPASKHNNAIFSHWYESDVDNGYDHRKRYDAYIELDTLTFKIGNVQLEKANKKNGFIESYSVTFYGNLTQLKDKFKDIKLRDLTSSNGIIWWDILNHTYNSTEVKNRITGSGFQQVAYPLIGSKKKYYYKNGIADQDITLLTAPIIWNELFPAVPIGIVWGLIQETFGLTFNGSFFDLDQWTKLYLYLKNAEKIIVQTELQRLVPNTIAYGSFPELSNGIITTNWLFATGATTSSKIKMQLTIIPSDLTLDYTLFIYKNNLLYKTFKKENRVASSAGDAYQIDLYSKSDDPNNNVYEYKISSTGSNSFKSSFWYWRYNNNAIASYTRADTTAFVPTVSNIDIKNYVPDIKITDFITGIIKAFNLMVIPTDTDTFEFVPLELYYNQGKITDITKYINADEMTIDRPKLFKAINFQYEQSTNILNNAYKGIYGKEYGDLTYNAINSNESSNYDIKLPFENVLFERTVGENFETATLIDKDSKPYTPKPMLIYCNGISEVTDPILITTEGVQTSFTSYNRFSNEYNSLPTDATLSQLMTMNFNNEQSPWYNVIAPQGLYYRHYSNYIDNLYNIKTRNIKVKAILPISLLSKEYGIALNDRLVISGKRYIINSFTTDLTTGEASFDLITDYRNINARSTVGYKFANIDQVQTDRTPQTVELIIYKNDYDSFGIKGAENYLIYITSTDNVEDLILSVDIPYNSGADRTDLIGIEYIRNGAIDTTEYVAFIQTAI